MGKVNHKSDAEGLCLIKQVGAGDCGREIERESVLKDAFIFVRIANY